MVFRIVAEVVAGVIIGVVAGVIAGVVTLLPGSSLEEYALTSMRVDRFFLRVKEKILPLHGGRR
jgi:uncharacterized membrane protein